MEWCSAAPTSYGARSRSRAHATSRLPLWAVSAFRMPSPQAYYLILSYLIHRISSQLICLHHTFVIAVGKFLPQIQNQYIYPSIRWTHPIISPHLLPTTNSESYSKDLILRDIKCAPLAQCLLLCVCYSSPNPSHRVGFPLNSSWGFIHHVQFLYGIILTTMLTCGGSQQVGLHSKTSHLRLQRHHRKLKSSRAS